jgi:hypothetical protein
MAKLADLARMTTATTGTGTITLGAAVSGCLSFAAGGVSDGDTIAYGITDGNNSEVGWGVYTASGTTLTRNVIHSTNSDSAISLSGNAQVFVTVLAEDLSSPLVKAPSRTPAAGSVKIFSMVDLVPAMTSATAPSGTASASSEFGGAGANCWQAFSLDPGNNGWLTNSASTGWLAYQFVSAQVVKAYEVIGWSADTWNARVPVSWTFQGSNDGTTWTTLDTQSSQATEMAQWVGRPYFILSNTTAYTHYRLNITANNGNAYLGVARLKMMGFGTPNSGKPACLFIEDENGAYSKVMTINSVGVVGS